jgi:hypothetical protein
MEVCPVRESCRSGGDDGGGDERAEGDGDPAGEHFDVSIVDWSTEGRRGWTYLRHALIPSTPHQTVTDLHPEQLTHSLVESRRMSNRQECHECYGDADPRAVPYH